jgi:hypothetical protein
MIMGNTKQYQQQQQQRRKQQQQQHQQQERSGRFFFFLFVRGTISISCAVDLPTSCAPALCAVRFSLRSRAETPTV